MFLKELMLIKQANQKSVLFATMGISEIKVLNFNKMSAKDAMILLMMSMNLSDIAILNIKSADYHCNISGISKSKVITLMQNTDLSKKENIANYKNLL